MTTSHSTQTAATESSSYSKLTVPQLKSILKEHNLPLSGVKAELISRLENHHATGAAEMEQSSSNGIEESASNNNNLQSSSDRNQSDSTNNRSRTSTTKFPPPKDKTEIQVVEKEVHETVRLLDSLKLGGNKSNGSSNDSSLSVSNSPASTQASGRSAQAAKSRQLTRDQEKELMNSLKQSLRSSQHKKQKDVQSTSSTSKSADVSSAPIISGENTDQSQDQLQSYIDQIRLRSANDIKAELQSLKLPMKGRKPDLVTRLAEYYVLNGREDGVGDDMVNDGLVGIEMPKGRTSLEGRKNTMSSFAGISNLSKNAANALQYAFGNNNESNNEKEASLTASLDPEPTPIQSVAISKLFYPPNPSAILHAPTGSGKTITYLLPVTETLWKEVESSNNGDNVDPNDMANGMALILLPTRELASQVAGVATVLAPPGMVRLIPQPMNLMNCWKKENDRGEEYEYLERVGNDETEEDEGKGTRRYTPRILVGSAKSISISLFGDKKMPGTPTNKPQGKQLLSSVRWLVMDEVDRLLDIKKSRTDKRSRHERPAALLSAAIARLTLGRVQVIAASATVGRPLRRELSRVLGLHSSECPETLRGEVDTNNMNQRINDNDTIHVGRAVKIPDTVRNYVLPVDGSTSGSLLTSAAFASKSILQSSTSFDNVVGRKVLLVLTRNCDIKVHNALGALRHFGIKPEPQSLLDALGADGTDRLVEAHRRVSGVVGVGGSANNKRQRGKSSIVNNEEEENDGYLLVTHEDNVRGLHLDGLDAVIVVGRPGSPDEYTHIAGRTGRAGKRGSVLNIVSFEQAAALASWTKMLGVDFLPVDESDIGSVISDE